MFKCTACKYETDNKFNYDRHIKTKIHLNNINSKLICSNCFKQFSNIQNTNRHYKKCIQSGEIVETEDNFISTCKDIFFKMLLLDILKFSRGNYVYNEICKKIVYQKCCFMQYLDKITLSIQMSFLAKFKNIGGDSACLSCPDCVYENIEIVSHVCDKHKLTHNEGLYSIVKALTDKNNKFLCIVRLKQFYDDSGDLLIKYNNKLYSIGILNICFLESKYGFLVDFKKERDLSLSIDEQNMLKLYEDFYKHLENDIKRYKKSITN